MIPAANTRGGAAAVRKSARDALSKAPEGCLDDDLNPYIQEKPPRSTRP
jgi:hypothetical protein